MEEKKLSFNKRIAMVKKEVFEKLAETNELDEIKGTDKTGFYSLANIEKYLHQALDKNELDLDLEIFSDKIIGHWYDCVDENQRDIEIDFSRIVEVGKLSLMANIVQSEGAVKSYTRRYSLTTILRLPSTDKIDTNKPQKICINQSQIEKIKKYNETVVNFVLEKKGIKNVEDITTDIFEELLKNMGYIQKLKSEKEKEDNKQTGKKQTENKEENKKTQEFTPNTKQFYTLSNNAGFNDIGVKEILKMYYKIDSAKQLNKQQFTSLINYFTLIIEGKSCNVNIDKLVSYCLKNFRKADILQLTTPEYNQTLNDLKKQQQTLKNSLPMPDNNKYYAKPANNKNTTPV